MDNTQDEWAYMNPNILKEFYKDNPSKKLNGKTYSSEDDNNLNDIQKAHLREEFNVYAPVETCDEQWTHQADKSGNFISADPIEETRVRNNLPPVTDQWKRAYIQQRKIKDKNNE